jgi:multiple antibiotic resistance protein
MLEHLGFALVTLSAVFFVVDPIAAIPVFLAVTRGDSPEKKRATALRASIVCAVTLCAFAAAGGFIFRLFGISLGAFKIAGGLLLFLIALDMMRARPSRVRTTPEEEQEGVARDDVSIIPLAFPMLSGPGSIATVMVLMSQAHNLPKVAAVVAAILVTSAASYLLLRGASLAERRLRQTGINLLARVMGLILAAIAVQFVVDGIRDVLPSMAAVRQAAAAATAPLAGAGK